MAVAVEYEPEFKLGKPEVLFQGTYVEFDIDDAHVWDIHPDDKRFLMIKKPPEMEESSVDTEPPQPQINVVLNWFEELKQRIPVE